MTDLSDYELRVLRQMATGEDQDIVNGAALWTAVETLRGQGLVGLSLEEGPLSYFITDAGRALVRAKALDELMANDAELTEKKNG